MSKRDICCKDLEDNLTGVNGHGAGLHLMQTTSIKDGKKRNRGIFIRATRKQRKGDAGFMIRWCPFCRVDLEEFFGPGGQACPSA